VATIRLSDTMITAMLDALRHRRTDDGRYETFAPVRTRDALVARGKVVRTQEYRDNNGDEVVRWYLTEDGITYLRNALEYVLNQRGEERDAVWQEWLNAERRNQWAVIDFLGLTADTYKLTTTEPHSIHQDTETLSRADAWERMGNAMTNGQRITLDDGALTVHTKLGARWTFTPQGSAVEEAPEARPCEGCGADAGEPCTPLSMCTADLPAIEERGMVYGPHRIFNTGDDIEHTAGDGGKYGIRAFECTRCGKRAILADFEYGRAGECTAKAEAEWSRECADALLEAPAPRMVASCCSCGAGIEMPMDGPRPACTHNGETRPNGGVVIAGKVVRPADRGTCYTDRHIVHDVPRWESGNYVPRCGECVATHLGVSVDALPGEEGENLRVEFMPQDPAEEGSRPCLVLPTGEQVYAYRKGGRMVVAVEVDGTVPMVITVQGETVFEV
jgi:hypothetical protein